MGIRRRFGLREKTGEGVLLGPYCIVGRHLPYVSFRSLWSVVDSRAQVGQPESCSHSEPGETYEPCLEKVDLIEMKANWCGRRHKIEGMKKGTAKLILSIQKS